MEFKRRKRITEQPVYGRVLALTQRLRTRGVLPPDLYALLEARGVDADRAVLVRWGPADRGELAGAVVTPDRRVLELTMQPAELPIWSVADVTEDLGQLDPEHPLCEGRQSVSVALMVLDDERAAS